MMLRTRIIGAMAACALVIAGLASFATQRISVISAYTKEISTNWLPSVEMVGRASENVQVFRQFVLRHTVLADA